MPITKPTVNADTYQGDVALLEVDSENLQPKVGTTVQEGWDAADALLKSDVSTEFPTDFKFSEEPQLIKFLQSGPFASYDQHWIERPKGKKSFVCLKDDCPLCDVLGDKPRGKFAFNVLVLTGEEKKVQILTAPPSLYRQLKKAHEDDRKGPLNKEFWAISRSGNGPTTTYTLDFVRGRDLSEEWGIEPAEITALEASAEPFTAEVIRETPRSEMMEVARSVA
ncbi:MAG: hypothetical protein EBT07_01615 [Actinobacteria bacterium]|jgi:hypothetical protein|nr:hypothetical protein [Actinomycetota bacterium]